MQIKIIGAGLAGCEAALWLADHGVQVDLYEQKPIKFSPAHKSAGFAELICSNSLKAERPDSASGLLKIEMRMMGSHLLDAAETARVAAGGALAVDRDVFSNAVTEMVEKNSGITVHHEEVTALDESVPVLVASGPLTATFMLPFAMGACDAVGGNVVTDAFGVVAMVAMTPLVTIQLLGVSYKRRIKHVAPAAVAQVEEIIELA